jgi:SOS-response transcriptional repressor LexA
MKELENKVAKRIEASINGYTAIKGERMSWAGLAKNIGYTPQAPTNWKKGKISIKVIEQIADFLGADPTWLMYGSTNEDRILSTTGIGKSKLTNPHIDGLNPNFNATEVDAELSRKIESIRNTFVELDFEIGISDIKTKEKHTVSNTNTDLKNVKGVRLVPVISYVQAGAFKEAILEAQETFVACYAENLSENAFALEVKGESMMPDFKPGDKIVIDPDVQPIPGDFVIAQNGEHEATFKKYRPRGYGENGEVIFELTPLNSDYPTLNSLGQPIKIIGTVIEHIRALRRRTN